VVRDGSSQFQAMVIGSDVSAFVSQHKSLLFSRKREVHFKERSGEIGAEEDREDCHSEASSRFSDDSDAQTRSSGNTGRLFNRINENLMKAESADIDLFKQSLSEVASLGKRERWLLKSKDLKPVAKEEVLGVGGFGVVRKYLFRGSPVAVKTPRVRSTSTADCARALRSLLNELRVLRQVRHPNIVLFHGMVMYSEASDATILALVFELIQGIPLNTYLSSNVSDVARHKLMLGACCALRYLHSNDPLICHGDIKDVNILVESWSGGPRARLLDFGLAHVFAA